LHEYRKPFTFVTDKGKDTDLLLIKCDYSVKSIANDVEVGEIEKVTVAERGGHQQSVSPFMKDLFSLLK
jgi:hypothetical protein